MPQLSESRAADRAKMATMVEALCQEMGASVERIERDREIRLEITAGDATVGIEFDGGPYNTQKGCYCMPWNTSSRFTAAFGRAVGAEVNPHHYAKCMGFADGIDALLLRLRLAMECVNDGRAFQVEGEPIPFVGTSHDPRLLEQSGYVAMGEPAVQISAGCFQRVAHETGVPQSELTSFRMPDGYWRMFRRPAVTVAA